MEGVRFVSRFIFFPFFLFACGSPAVAAAFGEKTIFASLYCLCFFDKDQLTIFMWIYFLALRFAPFFFFLIVLDSNSYAINLFLYYFKIYHVKYITASFPGGSDGKESACSAGDQGSITKTWVRKIPWNRQCQLTPVFLPGEFHGQQSLMGYSPWGRKESDTTE